MNDLPYREAVGAAMFAPDGRVLVARRAEMPAGAAHAWQMPQGGIDEGETPRQAVMRELREEIGTDRAEILAELDSWLTYDLPADKAARVWHGRYRGQRQRWFALRFLGTDGDIVLDRYAPAEFDAWRFVPLGQLPDLVVPFKRHVYQAVVEAFAAHASALAAGRSVC